jgi:nitroreductase
MPADNNIEIHPLIRDRRSTRAFSGRAVDESSLLKLLEASRWAPSSFNEQPWRFIVARKDESESFSKMLSCLSESNQLWAKNGGALLMPVAKLFTTHNHYHNRHAFHDVGLAIGNLTIQATAMNLFVHQMGGFEIEKARELYGIPAEYDPVTIIVIGYAGEDDSLPQTLAEREKKPRVRIPMDQLVYSNHFGEITPWLNAK